MDSKYKKLFELFSTTFLISASTSGGYAIIGMMKNKFVNKNNWLSEDEMSDLLAIAQSAPGPIAINASILVGYRVAGIFGALLTMLGTTLPPLIIMMIVSTCYEQFKDNMIIKYLMRGMQAGVVALLVSITVDLFTNLTKQNSIISYLLFIVAFVLIQFTNINVFFIAVGCAIVGIIKVFTLEGKK